MKSKDQIRNSNSAISSRATGSLYPLALAVAIGLSGCQPTPESNEATLDLSHVQGSSFDEPATTTIAMATIPVPSPDASAPQPMETLALPSDVSTSALAQDPNTPYPVIATAADVPDDISKIPSAIPEAPIQTPVPDPADATIAVPAQAPIATGEFEEISFKVLSGFKYEEPIPNEGDKPEDVEKRRTEDQIPAEVMALDGKKSVVQGWMVPMEINEDGSVKSFVLVKTQPQCCFGDMQAMNEWIDVAMAPGKTAEFNVDIPVKVYGNLEVGEKKEDGFVLSVYRMKGERVEL